jgi:micrococcal nuclease
MTRIRTALLLTTALVAAVLAVGARRLQTSAEAPPSGMAVVTWVVDGDTLRVNLGGRTERVRLIGIDTPESVKPHAPVECFAKEASAHTRTLVPPGTSVRLVRDVEARDRYGRLLAYVYRPSDDLFVNLALARDGYAAPLTIAPNVAHAEEFAAAASQARQGRRGLWDRCGGPHEAPP